MKKAFLISAALLATSLFGEEPPPGCFPDPAAQAQAKGSAWLIAQQGEDGSFCGDVGLTGLAVAALARSGLAKDPRVEKAIGYLLKNRREDGGIYNDDGNGLFNYRTSVALMALSAVDPVKHRETILAAQNYIMGIQRCEKTGVKKGDPNYGGIGYGSNPKKNDMSNLQMALQALKESGCQNDEVFRRAAEFAEHCQNAPTNPLGSDKDADVQVGEDGGFVYSEMRDVDASKAGVETTPDGRKHMRSYGSMTYAGLLTMVYAHLTKEDPRVGAAWGWIQKHYTLQENPGMASDKKPTAGKQGLYYYYLTFAKAMKAMGESHVGTPDGKRHRWAQDLQDTLLQAQRPEGFWVNEAEERWMEGNPVLATSYALVALQICREDLAKP